MTSNPQPPGPHRGRESPDPTPAALVPAPELARWMGFDQRWLDQRAETGQIPAQRGGDDYLVDPRHVQDALREEIPEAAGSGASLAEVADLSLSLASSQSEEAVAGGAIDRVLDSLGAACGGIFLSEPGGRLRLAAARGLDQPSLADAAAGLSAWVAASGHSLILPDTRRADEFSASARPDSPHDALAVPLLIDERATGVLLAMRRLEASPFSDRDHAVATVLAGSLALAIERARMQETLKRRLESSNFFQRQLEAYALDVRKTYAAEKRRAEELAAALSELKRTYLATVRGLAIAVDAKDQYTAGHLVRVTRYGLMLMRVLEPEKAGDLQFEYGFLLHDIGKLGVPDAVLAKSTPLTGEERELMDRHPEIGRRILEDIPFLAGAKEIVYAHHERWDGEGYPRGLKGLEIPLGARVFPLADCLDAMTTDRPYRKAMPMDQALDEIRKGSGTQFWPEAVEALGSISEEELEAARLGPTEWDPTS